jgi:FMN-dependent NADH-azoreductase
MSTLLQINSSLFLSDGQSTQLAGQFVENWRANHPSGTVIVRDLASHPIPHLDAAQVTAFFTPPEARNAEQAQVAAQSEALIKELEAADIVVLGLPMYNFGIPSTLKAYFDQIARAGISFRYTETGPVGLLKDKNVLVFATRGGQYAGTALDTQTGHVKNFLNCLGIRSIEFVYAEGLNRDENTKTKALADARARLAALAA